MIKYFALSTKEDDLALLDNPDRGFYFECEYDVAKDSTMYTEDGRGAAGDLNDKLQLYREDMPKLVKWYIHLNGYRGRDIDEEGLCRIQKLFDLVAAAGLRCILSFVYQYDINGIERDGKRLYVGSQGDGQTDAATVFRHIRQLKPIIYKNRKLICLVQMGFVGAWGEWSLYDTEEFTDEVRRKIIYAVADMVPEDIYLAIRQPIYKKQLLDKSWRGYNRIGFHCDAIFGTLDGNEYGSTGWDKGKEQWDMAMEESKHVPVLGELFWGWWFENRGMTLEGKDVLEQLIGQRFFSLNIGHSYKENGGGGKEKWPLYQWKTEKITRAFLQEKNYPYTDEWFSDIKKGVQERSVFEYLRDFLGYRIYVRSLAVNAQGDRLCFSVKLQNDGFSAPYNMTLRAVRLNDEAECVQICAETEGKSLPKQYDFQFALHRQDFNGGAIALELCNPAGQRARLANKLPFERGYNIILRREELQ